MGIEDKIRVFIVDDHQLLVSSMKLLLQKTQKVVVVGEANSGMEFLKSYKDAKPDVVLMDVEMPELSGIEASAQALYDNPKLKIIMVSMRDDFETYNKAIQEGVSGFVLKTASSSELMHAIESVLCGIKYFSSELLENVVDYMQSRKNNAHISYDNLLSKREKEVLSLICDGFATKDIAVKLNIADRTVSRHRENLMKKSKAGNMAQLAVFAIKYGFYKIK